MTPRVRDGRPPDLPALRAIQSATLAEPWTELLSVAADGPPVLLVADPGTVSPAGATAGGDSHGPTPVGYALAVTDGDDAVGYLVELAVAPAHQGEGVGSVLLAELVERLRERGTEKLRVTVRAVDERAREFYSERCFERVERLPDHYDSGDGLLLARDLT
jgi:ribosomal-protein-alanine N-acetyltransferase